MTLNDRLGSFILTPQALDLRDYILRLRKEEIAFQEELPKERLEQLPDDNLWTLLRFCIHQTPLWIYADTEKNCLDIVISRIESAQYKSAPRMRGG